MPATLHHIPLDDLKVSKLNVRKHGPKEIGSLAVSIAALGILQPLIVRRNCDGYEIVAGQRRYLAAKSLRDDDQTAELLPCVVLESDDDARAIEASLAENIERLPMDEMDQHEAFMALRRKGLTEPDIAAHFGISEQVVKRRLALANLIPDIRRLYRQGDIDAKTLQLLTLATKERQKAWVRLTTDPEETPPPCWQLKAWLLGGAEIACHVALFDEALYTGAITADLFGEARYFNDPDEFWRLQNAAIAEMHDKFQATGWRAVHVVPPNERFQSWDYEPVPKTKGGAVYIDVAPDGAVVVHKGLLPRDEARNAAGAFDQNETPESTSDKPERPELSAPLVNTIDLIRHSAVRLAVAKSPKVALRLALAHMIGGSKLWTVEAEPQTPCNDAIASWRETLPTRTAFAAIRDETQATLGVEGKSLVQESTRGEQTAAIFARLSGLSDNEVLTLLAVVMAETLAMGTDLIDTLGTTLEVNIASHWQPDDLFFELVRDREAVTAMLTEVIGETAARTYLTDTGTKKKALIRKALAGERRPKVEGWLPRYLRFPQAQYTERPMTSGRRAAA